MTEQCKTVQYDQGGEAAEVMFQLVCKNTPVGTIVNLTSDNQDGVKPPIYLPDTIITNPNSIVGVECYVSANYSANLTYCYMLPRGVEPPAGFSITLRALIQVGRLTEK